MPKEKEAWLKYYEGQSVVITFRLNHERIVKLSKGESVTGRYKDEEYIIKKAPKKKKEE